jgi:hypothetical protein
LPSNWINRSISAPATCLAMRFFLVGLRFVEASVYYADRFRRDGSIGR